MTPRDKLDEPGADILPDTPAPSADMPEDEKIEEEGEPFGENFA